MSNRRKSLLHRVAEKPLDQSAHFRRSSRPTLRLIFFFLLAMALPAAAQYPNRTVTMLTGYPAGGLVDIVARMVAENMKPRFPAGVVVVNRPGAAGAVAVGELTRA